MSGREILTCPTGEVNAGEAGTNFRVVVSKSKCGGIEGFPRGFPMGWNSFEVRAMTSNRQIVEVAASQALGPFPYTQTRCRNVAAGRAKD